MLFQARKEGKEESIEHMLASLQVLITSHSILDPSIFPYDHCIQLVSELVEINSTVDSPDIKS